MAYIENDSSNDQWEMVQIDCDAGSRVAIIRDEKYLVYHCLSNDPDFGIAVYNNGVLAASTVNELKRKLKKLELQTSGRKSELVQRLMDTGLFGDSCDCGTPHDNVDACKCREYEAMTLSGAASDPTILR